MQVQDCKIPNSISSYCCKKMSYVYLIVQKLWGEHSRTNTNDNSTDVEITEKTPRQFKQRQKSVQTLLGSLDQQYRPCKMAPLSLRYYFTRPKSKTNWSASKWPRTTFRVVSRKFPRMSAAAAASEHRYGGKRKSDLKITIHMFDTKGRCWMFIKTHQIIFSPPLFEWFI